MGAAERRQARDKLRTDLRHRLRFECNELADLLNVDTFGWEGKTRHALADMTAELENGIAKLKAYDHEPLSEGLEKDEQRTARYRRTNG